MGGCRLAIDPLQEISESLRRLLETAFAEKFKNEIRTTIPGHILDFDAGTQLATVQIGIERLDIHGKSYNPPPIVNCPLCIYGGTGGVLEVQIAEGDECLIHFSQRCIDGWRQQGGISPLVKLERFREADAFAVLAPRSSKNAIAGYSNDGIKLRSLDGTVYAWLKNDGTVELKNDNGTLTIQPGGDINANGCIIDTGGNVTTDSGTDLDAFKAEYDAHVHGGVQSGAATTTGPQ